MIDGEIKCCSCGEKSEVKDGKFVCDSPMSWNCEYAQVVQEFCSACESFHPIEWEHRFCDVCGMCYDNEEPCIFH